MYFWGCYVNIISTYIVIVCNFVIIMENYLLPTIHATKEKPWPHHHSPSQQQHLEPWWYRSKEPETNSQRGMVARMIIQNCQLIWFSPAAFAAFCHVLSDPVPTWPIVKLAWQKRNPVVALTQGQSETTNILRCLFAWKSIWWRIRRSDQKQLLLICHQKCYLWYLSIKQYQTAQGLLIRGWHIVIIILILFLITIITITTIKSFGIMIPKMVEH